MRREFPVRREFPFSAVVGHDEVKLGLLLNALDPSIGGVLLRGHKGSAKTTLARALAALLPGAAPFVELPIGATEDRLIGTLDLAAALTGGEMRFQPGLLAAADGGVLYVDEINLLPDHLVDVLLDVAASGVNRVEREGISHSHPSRFVLIGSMNPEEGDLRPQLLDRFGLAVDVLSADDAPARAGAVRRRLAFDADPIGFAHTWSAPDAALASRLAEGSPGVVDDDLLDAVTRLCAAVGAEGLRADLTICRAAAALAGWEGRASATAADVQRVAPLALAHRARRDPLDQGGLDPDRLQAALQQALFPPPDAADPPPTGARQSPEDQPPWDGSAAAGEAPGAEHAGAGYQPAGGRESVIAPDGGQTGRVVSLGGAGPGPANLASTASGRRAWSEGPRGRLIGDRAPEGPVGPVAVAATARTVTARRQSAPGRGGALAASAEPAVVAADLRQAVREQRRPHLVVLAVDASGSMGADRRMGAAKGAVLSLLVDAYQKRDLVSLVSFRGDGAEVLLRPTGSVEVARARLARLPTGGRTPLAAGITAAIEVATAGARSASHRPLLIFLTDGRATSGPPGISPVAAASAAADRVRRQRIDAAVIDVEDGPAMLGLARDLAIRMGARYLTLEELAPAGVVGLVRAATGDED